MHHKKQLERRISKSLGSWRHYHNIWRIKCKDVLGERKLKGKLIERDIIDLEINGIIMQNISYKVKTTEIDRDDKLLELSCKLVGRIKPNREENLR